MDIELEAIFDSDNKTDTKENKMEEEITKAKQLLKKNGYVVKKWTRSMNQDADECVEMKEHGEQKDCCGCSCSVCLMQG